MSWTYEFSSKALKQLKKLDSQTQKRIIAYLNKRIDGCENPRNSGKPLVANFTGMWRYRVGDYRVICKIEDEQFIVLALRIGHRKEVY